MELRRLKLLHHLSRLGTIAAVADALAYSPSTVSVQLAELEREAGAVLLQRVGRGVELTAAGQRLAEHAAEALAADEAVRAELTSSPGAPQGRFRMTFVQTPALALLPGTLDRLARSAPDLQIEVRQLETPPALDELRSHTVDFVVGIEYDPIPVARHRDVDRQDLLREDMLLALRPDAAAGGPTRLADLEHAAWATGNRGTGLDAVVRNVCLRLGGFEPDIRHRSDDGLILAALVASGRAVALLPALLTTSLPQIHTQPLLEGTLRRSVFTAARVSAAHAPATVVARQALHDTAAAFAGAHDGLHLG